MGIIDFQEDLRNGMTLEDALIKHELTLKEAIDCIHKPVIHPSKKRKPYAKRNIYCQVEKNISKRGDAYHLRKAIDGKMKWGGSYDTLEEARLVKDFLNKNGWNLIKVNEACKKYGIIRRRK